MYKDTVTVFNKKIVNGSIMWYPTLLTNVDLNADKAFVMSRLGENSADRCILHVKMSGDTISGKAYMTPKVFAASGTTDNITFANGDFFIAGAYGTYTAISDSLYTDGLYNEINRTMDNVFLVTSCARFSVIPHIEVTGK